jgi:hypothetical protein
MIPTAPLAQIKNKPLPKALADAILNRFEEAFRVTILKVSPVPKRRVPANRKSEKVQLTSVLNCMAIKGIISKNMVAMAI